MPLDPPALRRGYLAMLNAIYVSAYIPHSRYGAGGSIPAAGFLAEVLTTG